MAGIIGNGFIPNDGPNGAAAPWYATGNGATGAFPPGSPGNIGYGPNAGDGVRPAWFGTPNGTGAPPPALGMTGILAQLANAVQAYIAKLGSTLMGSSPATPPAGAAAFTNVSLSSAGDPHLAISGTEQNADGTTASVSSTFDSMTGHANLFSTNDFGDGFTVATTVTAPNASGVTLNASATAAMNGGLDSVTMTGNGAISVTSNGAATALAAGQTLTLEGGEAVSEAADGSVSIAETALGENLTTTFTPNGSGGVDVSARGNDVTLNGDLITGGTTPVAQTNPPVRRSLARA